MKINQHFLIAGETGTGKTNALYSYILETSGPNKGTFKLIFVVYKTEEPLYEYLKEQLGKGISFYKSIADLSSVNEFPDAIVNVFKYQYLVVLDNCVNDKDKASCTKIKNYFTYGRKKGITLENMAHFNVILKNYIEFFKITTEKKDDELPFMKINYCQVEIINLSISERWDI
jgi:hypothetical protein